MPERSDAVNYKHIIWQFYRSTANREYQIYFEWLKFNQNVRPIGRTNPERAAIDVKHRNSNLMK